MRDSIIFYRSFYEAVKELSAEDQAMVYTAIFEYSLNFNESALSGLPKAIFTLIKPQLDANNKKYENGKKGGRKKPNDNQNETKKEPKSNQTETETEANVNDNVNVNDNNNLSVNWGKLLEQFNSITGKKIRVLSDKAKKQIKARLREGYTKEDIVSAIVNCFNDSYHREHNYKWLTPEFISRADKMEKYANINPDLPPKQSAL